MAGQLSIILFFAVRWMPQSPRHAILILAVQLAVAAVAPVFLLGW